MKTELFNFELPAEFIAKAPVVPRDHCKLLVYDTSRDEIYHKRFFELPEFLNPNDLLVLNSSKVIAARVVFAIDGSKKEVFILRNLGGGKYVVMVKPGRFFQTKRKIEIGGGRALEVLSVNEDGTRNVKVNFELESIGEVPLPPYIQNENIKFEDYQTIYAKTLGSVAAPTAGLHFTEELFAKLKNKGVVLEEVTLHVGLGTFLPVKAKSIKDHFMHKEIFSLEEKVVDQVQDTKLAGGKVVAVGTTSVRVLETVAKTDFKNLSGETDIFIYPKGHDWKVVDGLVTNFHLPKSTLLMLVASFLEHKGVRDPVKKLLDLYEVAKKNGYRFYSFGDAMFIF